MLENLYTTQMSNDKEQLKTRLENIQRQPKKKHKAAGLLVFLALAAALTVGTICLASTTAEDVTMTDEEFAAYLDRPWGAVMATLDYADRETLVFHYDTGLFRLDLADWDVEKIFDLSDLNITTWAQGDVFLQVDVTLDGSKAYLSTGGDVNMAAEFDTYVVDLTTGQVKKGEIPEDAVLFRNYSDTSTVVPEVTGWYDWRCVVDSQTYYLSSGGPMVRDLQLVIHHADGTPDEIWHLFGEAPNGQTSHFADLSFQTANYMDKEFHRVYDPHYDIQELTLSNWQQEGNTGTFFYTMTYLRYNRDPDKADYIRSVKDTDPELYQRLYDDYLALQQSNYAFKIVWEGDTPQLYSEVDVDGGVDYYGPITLDSFVTS